MFELAPCPVCGKRPKIRFKNTVSPGIFPNYIRIRCKPFMEKPHVEVVAYVGTEMLYRTDFDKAAIKWNSEVKTYEKSME